VKALLLPCLRPQCHACYPLSIVPAGQAGLPGLIGVPAIQLALAQWTNCAVVPGGNSVGDPSGPWPDLCGYAQRVYQPAFDLPTLQVHAGPAVTACAARQQQSHTACVIMRVRCASLWSHRSPIVDPPGHGAVHSAIAAAVDWCHLSQVGTLDATPQYEAGCICVAHQAHLSPESQHQSQCMLLRRSGIDPAALQVTNLFAYAPVGVIVSTTQLPAAWVGLLKGYLYYVTSVYGGPAMQSFVLGGPLLSANAGGYIAKRSVHDWLYGEDVGRRTSPSRNPCPAHMTAPPRVCM
jgi:hypothetical protein